MYFIKNYLLLSVSYNTCKWDYSDYNDFNSQWMFISYPSFSKALTIACFNKKEQERCPFIISHNYTGKLVCIYVVQNISIPPQLKNVISLEWLVNGSLDGELGLLSVLYPLPDPTLRQTITSDILDRQHIMFSQINDCIYYYSLSFYGTIL